MANQTLEEIISIVGQAAAYHLCMTYGGQSLYFPVNKPLNLPMEETQSRALSQYYAGETIEIPLAKKQLARWLVHDCEQTIEQVARQLRVSRTTVRRWLDQGASLSEVQTDKPQQMCLFD